MMMQSNLCSPHTSLVRTVDCAAQLMIQSPGKTQTWKTKCKRGNSLVYASKQLFQLAGTPRNFSSGTKRNPKLLQKFIVSNSLEPTSNELDLVTSQRGLRDLLNAFYRFSRPHTIFGTIIGITSVSLLPLESFADFSPSLWVGILKALVPSLAMNIYVVGLNQLFDIEIDKVNKPNLPLASGEFSVESGIAIVSTFLLMSLTLGIMFQSPPLFSALIVSFLLGSAYSVELPTLRWKKNAFLSALCIVIVRAIVVQFAFFIHIQKVVLRRPVVFTKSLIFAAAFMCLFTIVIALFKDIPDVDGDRDFGIQSLSVRLGQQQVFSLCVATLLLAYGAAIFVGASSTVLMSKLITVLGHSSFALMLLFRAQSVKVYDQASVTSFYMFIWKLFYAEYFLIPFVR